MARVKLSEFDTKRLLFPSQKVFQATLRTTSGILKDFFGSTPLVVKVDQGVKKRGLQGLVKVGTDAKGAVAKIREWGDNWSQFLVEPVVPHPPKSEMYLSLEQGRYGWLALESERGGIDIEKNWDSVKAIDPQKYLKLTHKLEAYHLAFLELNPYLLANGEALALDAAAEIDDTSLALPNIQKLGLVPVPDKNQSSVERAIAALDVATPASLKFRLINPRGSIWMLLSGGGASLVLSDEVADQGMGEELANYGEYSGAPSSDDVYSYTKLILNQMLSTKYQKPSTKRALVIAAGIANFTDVAKTFQGIIRAMSEKSLVLKGAGVKVFVRRGGPNEARGLSLMNEFLSRAGIPHIIHHHETPLTAVITDVKRYLKEKS